MNPDFADQATFRVDRHTKTGSDYGTPVTAKTVVEIEGWFDEVFLQSRTLTTQRVGKTVPTINRKALFAVLTDAGLEHRDEGEIIVGGVSQGRWTVERIDTAAHPDGISHFEATLSKLEEGR